MESARGHDQKRTAFRDGARVTDASGDASTDPYSNFSVPQDADVTADAPGQTPEPSHEDTVTDAPAGRSDEVENDPSVTAETPAEAEEIQPESPA